MKTSYKLIPVLSLLLAGFLGQSAAHAAGTPPDQAGLRTGLGQDAPKEPAMLRNLRLTDPLVQQKYLNEPDMLRFLRGTYSEACARGMLNKALTQVKLDPQHQYDPVQKEAVKRLYDSQRIWKMTSFEMEALFSAAYLRAANYCDCLMKEVPDIDLVNPRKGLEVVEKISPAAQNACERLSAEKTERQLAGTKK